LAAVIAHELAHIQLRHAAAIIYDQRLVNELSQIADRAASMASRNINTMQQTILYNRSIINAMITTIFRNGFAQEQEFEADAIAVTILRDAGYDPSALAEMIKALEKVQPLRSGGFNITHPAPAARLARLEKVSLAGEGHNTRTFRERRFLFFTSVYP
jgi:predicted Zn-dependent protease